MQIYPFPFSSHNLKKCKTIRKNRVIILADTSLNNVEQKQWYITVSSVCLQHRWVLVPSPRIICVHSDVCALIFFCLNFSVHLIQTHTFSNGLYSFQIVHSCQFLEYLAVICPAAHQSTNVREALLIISANASFASLGNIYLYDDFGVRRVMCLLGLRAIVMVFMGINFGI